MRVNAPSHIHRRQAIAKRSMFVGMDVHKESTDVSLAEVRARRRGAALAEGKGQ
jgi:hypothetical protein